MSKPKILIDPQPRTMDLIFESEAQRRLSAIADLTIFDAGPMPVEMLEKALPETEILIGQTDLPRERLERAPKLRTIFNVEGNFLPNIDYDYCFSRGIRVLIASPAFAVAVAEMALAFGLDLARGVSQNDRAFREGHVRHEREGRCHPAATPRCSAAPSNVNQRQSTRTRHPFGAPGEDSS